jgi:sugar phosphate isomerase/epimerase
VAVTGLHWLLVKPGGLSISSKDSNVRQRTIDVMLGLIDLCAALGGKYLVHGSPQQRRIEAGETRAAALARAQECYAAIAERAQKAGVIYCIEPLAAETTPLINTLDEAAQLVASIGSPALRTMLDCSSAGKMEKEPLPALVERWLPQGLIAHVQVNDRNRRGPGQGEQRFAPLLAALKKHGYAGDLAVEPFDYVPDGPGAAARAIGYLRGIIEALENP